jgi:beta-lactamase superfamily II metal-dependent hydrolase/glucan-binding YG repeat protein
MRKRNIFAICFFAIFIILFPTECAKAQTGNELNIYAIYLEEEEKGDSVLLESENQYLLVDIGKASQVPAVIKQLEKLNVSHVDIMFSHLHVDHMGANTDDITIGLRLIKAAGITIDTLYLPDPSLASRSTIYSERYSELRVFMQNQGTGKIVYLKTGDTLQFGDVSGKVVGPVNYSSLYPSQFTDYTTEKEKETAYENNCSLAVIFTCGNTRYFTAGDSYAEEMDALVAAYGSSLKCDIMKLCHHGTGTGNSTALFNAVQPSYSFASNITFEDTSETTGRWRVYNALKRASKYGMCYLLGQEKKTLIYHIVNDNITLYRGSTINSGKKMTGWQYLYGADGKYRTHDMYYLDSNCRPYTGIKKIGKHYYLFNEGGQMEYGTYKSNGSYTGWKTYSDGERYFARSSDKKYCYMSRGASLVGDSYYYFDENGYVQKEDNLEEESIVQIGSYYYAMAVDGSITVEDISLIDGDYYYFDSKGHMVFNAKEKVDGDYYLFDENGYMAQSVKGTMLYEYKNKTYAVRSDGRLVAGIRKTIDGEKYYFNSYGVLQKNKIITIGKHKYYFNKSGQMVTNKTLKLNGKKYKADKNGILTLVKSK